MKKAEASIISNKFMIEKINHNFISKKYCIYLLNGKILYVHSKGLIKYKSWRRRFFIISKSYFIFINYSEEKGTLI